MPDPVIVTERLTKDYGNGKGVRDLNLHVDAGEVFGFLGPNGAGKTTTIRILLDLIRPTAGHALVLGHDCQTESMEVRRKVGYLPGEFRLYENLTGQQFLRYVTKLRGSVDWDDVAALAERFGTDLTRPIGSLSKGNKQKVGLVQAFMGDPPLLILDEPTSGLDPLVQRTFNDLVREATARGATVLLSSHVLPEIEEVCDRIAMIRDGELVTVDTMTALRAKAIRRLEIRFSGPVPAHDFEGLDGVEDVHVNHDRLLCTVRGSLDALVKAAARHTVLDVVAKEPALDEIFLDLYGTGGAPHE